MEEETEKEIIRGIARAFFVSHWVDTLHKKSVAKPLFMQSHLHIAHREKSAPSINPPPTFYHQAWRLVGRVEDRNEASINDILRRAMKADGHHFCPPDGYAFSFGRFLGYHSTGHTSVSWFDTHEMFGLLVPPFDLIIDK
jgi:hypothetical protein